MSRASRTVKPPTAADTSAGRAGRGVRTSRPRCRRPVLRREAREALTGRVGRGRLLREAPLPPRHRASPPAARSWTTATTAAAASSTTAPTRTCRCRTPEPARTPSGTFPRCCPRWRSRRDARLAEAIDRAGSETDRDRRHGREHDAHRAEEDDRGDERIEARASIPGDDLLEHHCSTTGIRRTSTAPSAIAPTKRYGDGQRSASTPPAQ